MLQRLIPTRYPFDGENLDRIAQQPTFMGNEDVSVAIKSELCKKVTLNVKMLENTAFYALC